MFDPRPRASNAIIGYIFRVFTMSQKPRHPAKRRKVAMIFRSVLLAGTAALLAAAPASAQNTLTENINNTGIPRNPPALGLSSIYGLNPCSAGASVGVTTPLFGIGGAIASIDKECETRNNAAIVITGLKDETLAKEILCTIKDIHEAANRVGKPCLEGGEAAKALSSAPMKAADTASKMPLKPAGTMAALTAIEPVVASTPIRADAPAFCRVKGLAVDLYPECTTAQAPAVPQAAVKKSSSPMMSRKASPSIHHEIVTAPADQSVPDPDLEQNLKNPSWAEAAAYKAIARSNGKPPQIIQPAVAISARPPRPASADTSDGTAKLFKRGAAMVAAGDISAARMIYEKAAEAGSSEAALEIAKTYDATFLSNIRAVGIQPDPAAEKMWFVRAITLGDKKSSPSRIASR